MKKIILSLLAALTLQAETYECTNITITYNPTGRTSVLAPITFQVEPRKSLKIYIGKDVSTLRYMASKGVTASTFKDVYMSKKGTIVYIYAGFKAVQAISARTTLLATSCKKVK